MSDLLEQWKAEDGAASGGNQGNGVRMALTATENLPAAKAARVADLSKSLGIPEGVIVQNPAKAEQERLARQVEKTPLLARFAEEDKLQAAFVREDAEQLGGVFDAVADFWKRETDAVGRAWDKGQVEGREIPRIGNQYLAALQSGDPEAAARYLAEADAKSKVANPYAEQDAFGILRPGTVESAAPHVHEIGGKAVLLPSVDGQGNAVTPEAAAQLFRQNGQHAGIFASAEQARAFLGQPEQRRRDLFTNWKQKPESWVETAFGPGAGIEQLPRMIFDQLPTQANRAAWGAAGGLATGAGVALALGQAGPQVAVPEEVLTVPTAAVAGFFLGAKGGWSVGAAEAAFQVERGSFALDLAKERDANGQPLSSETIVAASNAYALLAAVEEGLGEAFFLTLLKPLGISGVAKGGVRGLFRDAVRRAALDKSTGAALLDVGARLALNATGEGLEEAAQEATGVLVEFLAKGWENAHGANFSNELTGNGARIGQAFAGGAAAGLWLGSGPIVVSGAFQVRDAAQAGDYAEKHRALHEKVEATNTKQLSPAHMQDALEAAGPAMLERVELPADAMLELYQRGTDLLTPLGITEDEAAQVAEKGHTFTVPVSKLHAFLDAQQFDAAAEIMRRTPDAMSQAEAAQLDARLASDAQKIVELYQDNAQVFDQLAAEKERLHSEAAEAIHQIPGLRAQVEALAGGVDTYVDTWVNTVERFALRMGATGQNPVDVFKRITLDSLRASRRASMTQEQQVSEDLTELAASAPAPGTTPSNGPLVHTGVETLDDLYRLAREAQPSFQASMSSIAQATGGEAHFRPGDGLKRPERVQRKIDADYPQDGAKRVLDVLGATLLYEDRAAVEAALPAITREIEGIGGEVARLKNRFDKPSDGYKDYLLNIRMPNGMVTELLLTTKAMSEAKAGPGHDLYEARQSLEGILTDKNVSEEQRSIARTMKLLLRRASENYYGSTGEGSNETASASVIEVPLNSASVLLEELSSTSVYPKLVSLLGNIRQVLPSVASTNGMSSYSTNFSTNTVPPSGKSNTRQGVAYDSDNPAFSSAARTQSGGEGKEDGISEPPADGHSITRQNTPSKAENGRIPGAKTTILGRGVNDAAHYEVRELSDVIPSHDPQNGFARRPDYPADAQERPYHSDAGEQEKVRGNALNYLPAYVLSTDATAGNGPSIITEDGIVLGGNSRAMTLQLVYADHPDKAATYRQELQNKAAQFGIDPAAVEGMQRPVLVRVVDTPLSPEEMAVKSRQYNQTTTQKLQAKAEGVSRGRMISAESLASLSEGLTDFDTLRQLLDSPKSRGFVASLISDGVIEQTEISSLTEKNGRLNERGKKLVEDALRGLVVPDYDILEATPPAVLNKLDRAIPALARLKARGEGWDLTKALTSALRIVGKASAEGRKVEGWLGQADLLDTDPDKGRPAVQALALTFANATQKEVLARFETMAAESERQAKGQGLLVAQPENQPGPAFVRAFLQPIAFVDGKAIAGFDPQNNPRHAALQWAYDHGGKGHSVAVAMERLHKSMAAKKATAAQKEEARGMMQALADYAGAVNLYTPKLGQFFRYQPGQELFSQRDAGPLGSTKIYPESYLVSLFEGANLSTLMHETGHVFFEEMGRMVEAGAADETMRRDYATLLNWLGAKPGDVLTVEQREQAARGFEAYLREGRAPSAELEGAFARFRRWLKKIYQTAAGLDVKLTDEVRGVFDRMLSTEREIAATATRNELLDLTARELDALGLTGTVRATAASLMPKAREAAAEALQKARDENRKARLAKYTQEAAEEVREMQVYKTRRDMRATPLDLENVRENFGEDTARQLMKTLPGALKNDGGIDPEIFAAEHGYESATAMIEAVIAAKRQSDAVADVVREKEAKHDAAYDAFEQLMETREVSIQMEIVGRKLADILGVEHLAREAYQRAARQELAAMPLGRAVQTGNFLAAMRRALQQERHALNAGDRQGALTAHRKAMLNMEFVRSSREIARRRESTERRMKRFIGMNRGDPDARYIVMDIGMRHALNAFSVQLAEGRDVRTIQEWMKAAEEDGYTIFSDDRILYGPGQPWREMGVSDFDALAETVDQIITVERNRRKLMTAQGKADLDEAAQEIADSIYAHRKAAVLKTVEKQPAALSMLSGLHAVHTKVEALCRALDGDKLGAAWNYIYRPITEADDRQHTRFLEVRDALKGADLFGAYSRKELAEMGTRRELVPEIGEKLSWENRIAVALNMGNATNIERIRTGHGWTDEQIAAVLRPLKARDWQFVQAVWNYIGTFKEESFQLQEDVNGLRPTSVEAQPLTVTTADGRTLQLEGGYYPIKYNSDKGFMAFQREQREMDKELFGGRNYGAAMTKNGHLKERGQGGQGTPLLLELSVITDHLFNVVHDLTYRKAVLDVAKVIRHKAVREAIESTVGAQQYRQLLPWLQDVANERQEPMHYVHRWARWARASTSIMQMGFKVTTMLAQPLGITQSAELLGYKWTGAGLKRVYGNPLKLPVLLEETFARSPMMANRIKSFDREVRDITKQLTPGMSRFGWVQVLKDKAFVPMGVMQMGVDLPTWWGAYERGLKEQGGDEAAAARYADSIVRLSQGSGATKDLARVQRGGELLRLTTMFYSYFNTFYNLGARRIALLKQHHSKADVFMAANTALLLWFVPAVFGELLAGRGPDEDEEPEKWLALQLLQYPFQTVVGVRDLANGIFGKYGYQITPAQSAPKSLVQWFKSVNKALEEEDAMKMAKPTAEAVGYIFGLPMKQPIITCGNLWDYLTGEDPDFEVRDLFFTKPKERR
ncbi:hypothetical protein [uncultured Desulfovibrio sp.]|uniref:hypothetical protein n=1 Tax=uncultured Desulfovibrio sp. TaxID=167968 RepID=UPI00262C43B7|nr:hypothetical protein [uncultured Desulfovibrio sp.]